MAYVTASLISQNGFTFFHPFQLSFSIFLHLLPFLLPLSFLSFYFVDTLPFCQKQATPFPPFLFCHGFVRQRAEKLVHPKYPRQAIRPKDYEIEPISTSSAANPHPLLVPPSAQQRAASRLPSLSSPQWNEPPVESRWSERGWNDAGYYGVDRGGVSGGAIRIYIRVKLNHIGGLRGRPPGQNQPTSDSYA